MLNLAGLCAGLDSLVKSGNDGHIVNIVTIISRLLILDERRQVL